MIEFEDDMCWNLKKIQREKERKKNLEFLIMISFENYNIIRMISLTYSNVYEK